MSNRIVLALVASFVLGASSLSQAAIVPMNPLTAAATFTQAGFDPGLTADGVFLPAPTDPDGWAIAGPPVDQTMVVETISDVVESGTGIGLTFTLRQNHPAPQHTLGRFRLSYTTDPRANFADGLSTGGDVTATWIQLTPLTATSAVVVTMTINGDNSVLVGDGDANPTNDPANNTYTITANVSNPGVSITGFRLEALSDPSLFNTGPGHADNFVLSELTVDAVVPEPASISLLALGFAAATRRTKR